jgi:hypothetical protein
VNEEHECIKNEDIKSDERKPLLEARAFADAAYADAKVEGMLRSFRMDFDDMLLQDDEMKGCRFLDSYHGILWRDHQQQNRTGHAIKDKYIAKQAFASRWCQYVVFLVGLFLCRGNVLIEASSSSKYDSHGAVRHAIFEEKHVLRNSSPF